MPSALRSQYDAELRFRLPPPPGRQRVDDGTLVRIVGPSLHPLDNMVAASRLDAASADRVIAALLADAASTGRGVQWNVFDGDEPADLGARSSRAGFLVAAQECVLVRPVGTALERAPADPALRVRRITREADLGAVIDVQEAVWGREHTAWLRAWWGPALRGEAAPIAIFLASLEDVDAGIGWVALHEHSAFASLFGGTVLAPYRRRGVHRALVAARAHAAREHGASWLVVDANEVSAPLLLAAGFRPLADRAEYVREARGP